MTVIRDRKNSKFIFSELINFDFRFAKELLNSLSKKQAGRFWIANSLKNLSIILDLLGLAMLGAWVASITSSGTPSSNSSVFESVLDGLGLNDLPLSALGPFAISLFLLRGVLSIGLDLWISKLVAAIELEKSLSYFQAITRGGLSSHEKFAKGKILNAVIDLPTNVFGQGLIAVSLISGETFVVTSISVLLLILNPTLFLMLSVIFGLVTAASGRFVGKNIARRAFQAEQSRQLSIATLLDLQKNYRQIISLGKLSKFEKRLASHQHVVSKNGSRISVSTALPRYFIEFGLLIGLSLLVMASGDIGVGGYREVTIGVFIGGLFRMVAALMPLQNQLNLFRRISRDSKMLSELEKLVKFNNLPTNDRKRSFGKTPKLIIQNLSYSYAETSNPVIEDLTLEIPFGSLVSIEGRSGKGKSTLADLILGLRAPTRGKIEFEVDGDYISSESSDNRLVAYVPQKIELISGTLLENLLLSPGETDFNEQRLLNVLKMVGLEEMVGSLPHRLETRVDVDTRFSGGQIQRIGLARALMSDSPILLLDESTASLDRVTEDLVLATLKALRGARTLIYISHNPDFLKNPDIRVTL